MAARWSLLGYPAALLTLGVLLAVSGWTLTAPAGTPGAVEEALGLAAALAGLGILTWWWAALALALAAEWLRRRGRPAAASIACALTPGFMRRLAAAVLGANLLAVPAGHAAPAAPPVHAAVRAITPDQALTAAAPDGGRESVGEGRNPLHPPDAPARAPRVSPDWVPVPVPCGPGLLAREPARRPTVDGPAEVVVRPGDSLWSIAAAGLGPLASDEEIAVSWPRWYSRNAPAIGPDPGLLLPGQVLRAPEPP